MEELAHYLQMTMSVNPEERNTAETYLKSVETQPGYGPQLLMLQTMDAVPGVVRQQGAIVFKNFVKKQWAPDEGGLGCITADDRQMIKTEVVDIMVLVPELVQAQLSQAIAEIGETDFQAGEWPELLPHMVAQFASGDFHVINGVLKTAHPLFERYRHAEKSDALWSEIKYVLEQLAAPLTELFTATFDLCKAGADAAQLPSLVNALLLIAKLFLSLNSQDLPEYFEDHIELWMSRFAEILALPEADVLASDDPSRPGALEELKTEVLESVTLYALKYDEEFEPFYAPFVEATWVLLTHTGEEPKYDALVSVAMKYLAHVAQKPSQSGNFASEETLRAICQQVVVPNMKFREVDEELFEDNPQEYIRRDAEGADADTRRRGATDLVRGLSRSFEREVIAIFTAHIEELLAAAAADPAGAWKQKDAAIFLVTSLAVKASVTGKGATETSDLIDPIDFFGSTIYPDLQTDDLNRQPVLKADALKYITTFRNFLTKEQFLEILPSVAAHLMADSQVVVSYAAHCIERSLVMKRDDAAFFTEAEVGGMAEALLTNLFGAMEKPQNRENDYLMKAILRTVSSGKGAVAGLGVLPVVVDGLSKKMVEIAKNPANARYNHYMFETMSCSIRYAVAADASTVAMFEAGLFPPFQTMLKEEIVEFQPYVFQIMAQMLEAHAPGAIDDAYASLFPFLLQPTLWESQANSSGLVRLLQAYIVKGGEAILDEDTLRSVLGIFQKLISSKKYDHEGFNLLGALVDTLPPATMEPYLSQCYTLCFTRMSKMKTAKFVRCVLVFTCLLAGKFDGSTVVALVDGIQKGLFGMLINRIVTDVEVVPDAKDRKIVTVGVTKLLFETPEMVGPYVEAWPQLLTKLYKWAFEMDGGDEGDEENHLEALEASGYRAEYNKLAFAGSSSHDPFGTIENPQMYFAAQLNAAGPGNFARLVPADVQPKIAAVLHAAGFA